MGILRDVLKVYLSETFNFQAQIIEGRLLLGLQDGDQWRTLRLNSIQSLFDLSSGIMDSGIMLSNPVSDMLATPYDSSIEDPMVQSNYILTLRTQTSYRS